MGLLRQLYRYRADVTILSCEASRFRQRVANASVRPASWKPSGIEPVVA